MLFYCILTYLAGQFSFWYLEGFFQPVLLITQQIAYFIAIVLGVLLLVKKSELDNKQLISYLLFVFFLVNLLLLIHWVVVVFLNPEINWKLEENNYEVDPWYYILYVPIVNFIIAFVVLVIAYVIGEAVANKKNIL